MHLQQRSRRCEARREGESVGEVPRPAARRNKGHHRSPALPADGRRADLAMIRRGLIIALFALPAFGQETGRTVDFAPTQILDLQFKITDLSGNPVSEVAGTVQDLQVKEIGNEVRIDLNADVLFDFDKADLLPKAQETLTKAAAIIKERAKGTVRVNGHTDRK